jgi:hypothetical protein
VRIEIDGKFAIDRAYEGYVIQRFIPAHESRTAGRTHKRGDLIPARWEDDCYPCTLDGALHTVLEDAVLLSPQVVTDLRAAIREWHRIEKAVLDALGSSDKPGGALAAGATTE